MSLAGAASGQVARAAKVKVRGGTTAEIRRLRLVTAFVSLGNEGSPEPGWRAIA